MNEEFDRITPDNLENFLEFHMQHPLPDWFPTTGKTVDYDYQDFNDGCILITKIKSPLFINHGLTVLPYI